MKASPRYTICSVVMAVYHGDRPEWFAEAIDSILAQTVKSDDIVIVRDGPVSPALESTIKKYELLPEVTVIRTRQNKGAGPARNAGIKRAKNELVAIMDADDVSLPTRFATLLLEFSKSSSVAIVGGQIAEFKDITSNIIAHRVVPTTHADIMKFARRRSPINHPTIIMRKSAFTAAGGYPLDMNRGEDYLLVAKLLAAGARVKNTKQTVLYYRVSRDNISRRKTLRHVIETTKAHAAACRLGIARRLDVAIVCTAHIAMLILPSRLALKLYNRRLRS